MLHAQTCYVPVQIREVEGKSSMVGFFSEGKALMNSVLGTRTEKQSNKIFKVISLSYFMPELQPVSLAGRRQSKYRTSSQEDWIYQRLRQAALGFS